MNALFENPMDLMGFEFVEFASPTPNTLVPYFALLGFRPLAKQPDSQPVQGV